MNGATIAPVRALEVDLPDYPRFAAPPQTHVVLTGPSGSGKSEFCLLLAGVLEAEREAGIRLFGSALSTISAADKARRIALVPSDPFLAFTGMKRTLHGELEMVQRLVTNTRIDSETFLRRVATRLDLIDHLDRDPFTLSGGEAVRAALAMALIKRPLLLVLDQMHEQLDPTALPRIQGRVAELLSPESVIVETRSRSASWDGREVAHEDEAAVGTRRWRIDMRPLHGKEERPLRLGAKRQRPPDAQVGKPPETLLQVTGLAYRYPKGGFSLGPIDLDVRAGERVALVGPNGSGKSTLLKCLALLKRPHFRRMAITGCDGRIATPPVERQTHRWATHALYCFQRPEDQLYLSTVREELAETSRRLGGEGTLEAAMAIARTLGLEPCLDRSPYDIPRSFRRLVPLAGALAVDPALLLLDEPTVGLDDVQVMRLTELLVSKRRRGATIVVSHDEQFIAAAVTRQIDIRCLQDHQGESSNPA